MPDPTDPDLPTAPSDAEPVDEPDRVTVAGTGATPDVGITMLEGTTGARLPTGEHQASGAMPSGAGAGSSESRGVLLLALTIAALAAVAVVVYVTLVS